MDVMSTDATSTIARNFQDFAEEWRPVTSWPGDYAVSNLGRVRNNKTGTILSVYIPPKNCHRSVTLRYTVCPGKQKSSMFRICKLVADAFLPQPVEGSSLIHMDGDEYNDAAENLKWLSPADMLNSKDGEQWKIVDFAPDYLVSNYGHLRTIATKEHRGRVMSCWMRGKLPYVSLRWREDGEYVQHSMSVGLLVAKLFCDYTEDKEIRYIDGDSSNVRADNILCVDRKIEPWCFPGEQWLPVVGYEGLYEVSSAGRVRSMPGGRHSGQILSQHEDRGYMHTSLTRFENGVRTQKMRWVHRLVAEAFIPNPENKPQVDHIDTNRSNNSKDNLRWATAKENSRNPITYSAIVKALQAPKSEETQQKLAAAAEKLKRPVRCRETGEVFSCAGEAERSMGLGRNIVISSIRAARNQVRQFKTVNGRPVYHFEYVDDPVDPTIVRKAKPNPKSRKVMCIETGEVWGSVMEAAVANGKDPSSLGKQCRKGLHNQNRVFKSMAGKPVLYFAFVPTPDAEGLAEEDDHDGTDNRDTE